MSSNQNLVNELVNKLQKRKVEGPNATALLTAELLRSIISQQKLPQTNQASVLLEAVKSVGQQLIAANPVELAVGNVVRRTLHIIREENLSSLDDADGELSTGIDGEHTDGIESCTTPTAAAARSVLHPPSLHMLLERNPSDMGNEGKSARIAKTWKLKTQVLYALNELIDDINTCHEQIAEQAVELIHHDEVILTLGNSRTVKEFLHTAKAKNRSFRVFIAEGAPRFDGHVLAKNLVAKGIQTTLITDCAVFGMISRVNKVIVGVHAVMANGGVIGPVGLHMIALAAKKHGVPFVVVAGTHKLCQLYPQNPQVVLNELRSPSELLDFGEFSDCLDFGTGSGVPLLNVVNPAFDYAPPELVSLFMTETGGHNPSFIYRLVSDYYSADDPTL